MKRHSLSSCNLCGGSRYYLVYRQRRSKKSEEISPKNYTISEMNPEKPDKIVQCMGCGLVYAILSKESFDDIKRNYADMQDDEYVREEKGRRAQARIVLSKILKFKKTGRLLDVGCGPGLFLDEAKRQGWEVAGVDFSSWAKTYAKEKFGIEIFQGPLEEAQFTGRSFDVIVMNDVIEHLEDPQLALKEIRRVLKNDGIVYISTPEIGR